MLAIILGIVFAVIGATAGDGEGFFFGGLLGALLGAVLSLRTRLAQLEREQRALAQALTAASIDHKHRIQLLARQLDALRTPEELSPAAVPPAIEPPTGVSLTHREVVPAAQGPATEPSEELAPSAHVPIAPAVIHAAPPLHAEAAPAVEPPSDEPRRSVPPPAPHPRRVPAPMLPVTPIQAALEYARAWLFGQHRVRVGILVLLVGVALLVRFAAENSQFPIELRMASAAAIGLALVFVG